MTTAIFDHALFDAGQAYLATGLSLIPVSHKTKRPREDLLPMDPETGKGTWKPYQERQATEHELKQWIAHGAQYAVVCGPISGGLRIYDFDVPRFYDAWIAQVGSLADGLPVQRTGGGGYQVAVRCPHAGKNEKLAWVSDPGEASGRSIAIETRGDGGYAVLAPSVHPNGQRYHVIHGDFTSIPMVSQVVIDAFDLAAAKLNEAPYTKQQLDVMLQAMLKTPPQRQSVNGQAAVIDMYNQSVTIEDALTNAGYRHLFSTRYARPGGTNPSVEVRGGKSFHHNTNDPLCDAYWHDAFDLYCFYEHHGDVKAAVKMAALLYNMSPSQQQAPQTGGAGSPPASLSQHAPQRQPASSQIRDDLYALGYTFRYNAVTLTIEVNGEPISDAIEATIRMRMRDKGYKNLRAVEDVYMSLGHENTYHPVRDYLDSLVWDGQLHISKFAMHFDCVDLPVTYANGKMVGNLFYTYLYRWMVGAVAKVYERAQNMMLVLVGPQNIGKSTVAKWLCSPLPSYFVAQAIQTDDKDSVLRLNASK